MKMTMTANLLNVTEAKSKDGSKIYHNLLLMQGDETLKAYISTEECYQAVIKMSRFKEYSFLINYNPQYKNIVVVGVLD